MRRALRPTLAAVQHGPSLRNSRRFIRSNSIHSSLAATNSRRLGRTVLCHKPTFAVQADITLSAPAIRRTGGYGILERVTASVCLEVGRPDHLGPLLGVVGNELAEIGGRAGKQRAAEVEQPRLELRILERCVDLPVEPVDDPDRRCLRRTDA